MQIMIHKWMIHNERKVAKGIAAPLSTDAHTTIKSESLKMSTGNKRNNPSSILFYL